MIEECPIRVDFLEAEEAFSLTFKYIWPSLVQYLLVYTWEISRLSGVLWVLFQLEGHLVLSLKIRILHKHFLLLVNVMVEI